ncbi:hypothetical protein HCU74_04695 [Spongiibacter sp. KMU-166]|uniref:DUF4345 domain-containing protein n=1 Tax=Spongiibacter thalassae TaxID=2721624 RepID=A0ABX1GDZ3_9GAMM|nr:hypothetical protein [Spongiibacter thalassae]NKI16717.1 hypothetical protein [Spongiibacter thalassae]
MQWLLKIPVSLIGVLMLSMGLRWLMAPSGIASELGMPLLDGAGLSTQIGDLSAFFLCIGVFTLMGLSTRWPHWYYAAALLLGLTAFGRVLAWLLHGAAFLPKVIGPEVFFTVILLLAARILCTKSERPS